MKEIYTLVLIFTSTLSLGYSDSSLDVYKYKNSDSYDKLDRETRQCGCSDSINETNYSKLDEVNRRGYLTKHNNELGIAFYSCSKKDVRFLPYSEVSKVIGNHFELDGVMFSIKFSKDRNYVVQKLIDQNDVASLIKIDLKKISFKKNQFNNFLSRMTSAASKSSLDSQASIQYKEASSCKKLAQKTGNISLRHSVDTLVKRDIEREKVKKKKIVESSIILDQDSQEPNSGRSSGVNVSR